MSNIEKIKEVSKFLAEPEWLLRWREERLNKAETLPKMLKYGIGILGVLPARLPERVRSQTGLTCPSEAGRRRGEGHPLYFEQTADYHVDASKGLELYTWKEAVAQEEVTPILEGLLKSEFFPNATNYYGGQAQAFFRSGLVVYVQPNVGEDGVSREEKLTLDTMVPKGSSADTIVVIVKEGAKLLFTSVLSGGNEGSIFARTLVVLTERDAHARVTQKQTLTKGTTALVSARGVVAAHSSVTWSEVFTGAVSIKSETENILIGESARGEILQGIVARASAKYDIFASAKHLADHTHSRIRAAGLGTDTSKTVYRGLIDMKEGIRAVDGAQEARFLVLSPKAEVDAIPSLDIASKEVQCTHKLSISHIRDTDLFYPKLRGLSDEESRQLFLEGHFAQVLSTGSPRPEPGTKARQDFSGEENEEIMEEIKEYIR